MFIDVHVCYRCLFISRPPCEWDPMPSDEQGPGVRSRPNGGFVLAVSSWNSSHLGGFDFRVELNWCRKVRVPRVLASAWCEIWALPACKPRKSSPKPAPPAETLWQDGKDLRPGSLYTVPGGGGCKRAQFMGRQGCIRLT